MNLALILQALSDKNRRKIIEILKESELTVSQIAKHFVISNATLSHHLNILRKSGLISSRRSGRHIFYALNLSVSEELVIEITKLIRK